MIFSISYKNLTAAIYSIPNKILIAQFPSCDGSEIIMTTVALFPVTYQIGTIQGVICAIDYQKKLLTDTLNILNGAQTKGMIGINNNTKALIFGNNGNTNGIVNVFDMIKRVPELSFNVPSITSLMNDSPNLEIIINSISGQTYVYHYLQTIVSGIVRP
jgi:hypothetical protein